VNFTRSPLRVHHGANANGVGSAARWVDACQRATESTAVRCGPRSIQGPRAVQSGRWERAQKRIFGPPLIAVVSFMAFTSSCSDCGAWLLPPGRWIGSRGPRAPRSRPPCRPRLRGSLAGRSSEGAVGRGGRRDVRRDVGAHPPGEGVVVEVQPADPAHDPVIGRVVRAVDRRAGLDIPCPAPRV